MEQTEIKGSVRALELSPSLEFPYYALSTAFYHLGFFDLADAAAKAGQAANPRTWREASRNLGRTALFAQRFETAAKELRRAEPFSDDGTRWMLGEAWFYLSEHAKSTELLESVERSTHTSSESGHSVARDDAGGPRPARRCGSSACSRFSRTLAPTTTSVTGSGPHTPNSERPSRLSNGCEKRLTPGSPARRAWRRTRCWSRSDSHQHSRHC